MGIANTARRWLLRLVNWLEAWMHRQPEFTLNDPEWNAAQNEVNSLKRDLNKELKRGHD